MLFRSDRKSTRLNSSHLVISYAVFCLKKKKKQNKIRAHALIHQYNYIPKEQKTSHARLLATVSYGFMAHVLLLSFSFFFFFFFNDTATTEIYTLSLHDALPISFISRMHFRQMPEMGRAF